jgi:hypothetical protein|tara:strand:- start:2799 stop:3674 length:876 start_codon:yes stop_codon:yes gene_type:complete
MGYYTENSGLIGSGTVNPTGVHSIISSHLSAGALPDLRTIMSDIGTAIQNGRTGYILTTNNYSYRFDGGDARKINDGTGDIFDNGNWTTPISSSTRSNSSPSNGSTATSHPDSIYYSQTTPLVHPTFSNYTYVAGGWTNNNYSVNDGPLIVATTTGNSGYQWCGWMVGGDSGADGSGTRTTVDLYNGVDVNGFTVYSSYMSTYNGGDPSSNDLYILLGHPNWGSVFGAINKYNNTSSQSTNSAMWSESTSQNNILAIKLFLSRQSATLPVQGEMQGIVNDIISDIKTQLGY